MKRILAALFALLSAASAYAAPFQNGGFEAGTLSADPCNGALPIGSTQITGWTVITGNIDYVTTACWNPAEGNRSLDLVGTGSIGGIQQTFDTIPSQTYQVIFQMAGNPSTSFLPATKNLSVAVNGTPHFYTFDTTAKSTVNMGWITYSFVFIATGTSTTISFVSDMTGSTFAGAALDNVRVVQTANPLGDAFTATAGEFYRGNYSDYSLPMICSGAGSKWAPTAGAVANPLTITSDGTQRTLVASYFAPGSFATEGVCGTWSTTATAGSTGSVPVYWDYRGNHSSFEITEGLQAYVIRAGSTVQSDLLVSSTQATDFQFSGQYTFNVQAGDVYGFTMTGSNYDFANVLRGTLTVVSLAPPLGVLPSPALIRALPSGSAVVPLLIGRADGLANTSATVRLFSGTTCVNGVLGGTITQVGSDASVLVDASGYFGTLQSAAQGQFVAVGLVSPQVTPLSDCVVTAADNDTWPKALRLTGATPTVPDWIDAPGKARWYRFSVLPGQSIQTMLSGLPADYDLALFKDIAREFFSQLVPVNTDQLTKLSAQYAPSAFSPSAFSPSAFSPSAFSPSAFSPSAFSPLAFSPSAFSPSAFSPSAFSPSAFSPSAFSPSAFSPSAFSPSAFSPSAFSPSAFSPSAFSDIELERAFSSAQTRSIIATSMTPGIANESVIANTWNNTGDFYVRVTGRAGAFSTIPYNLAVTKQGTSCAGVTVTEISQDRSVPGGGFQTIVLVDSTKTSLSAALPGGGTLGGKLGTFVQRDDVHGVIVDVGLDGRVGTLKAQASAAPNVMCPFAKNLVASEIKSIVDAYLLTNPLRYIVIVGNDDAIPFFRYPDQTLLGSETGYVPPVSSNSASEASLRGSFVLSQDGYGATTHISFGASEFPVPGVAVGRLVETPAEIAGMIDAYMALPGGTITPGTSLVTGYDFLQDAADAVVTELQAGTGAVPDTLITQNTVSPEDTRTYLQGGPWTAGDLFGKLVGSRHDVMFLAGHFSANSALAADFKSSLITSQLPAADVLTNTLVFSAGCHSGYNLVDTDAIAGVTFPLDWAQAFAQKKATLVAGTGYQYGDTDFLEYSERLYLNFAKELRAGSGKVAVGEALVKAKLAYLAATPDIRGLHEKAVLEATLFGLPMFGVTMPSGRTTVPANGGVVTAVAPPVSPAQTLGLRIADVTVQPTLTPHSRTLTNYESTPVSTVEATWLSGPDGVVTNPAEPALPLKIVNVTPVNPALVLRGVGFRGGVYSDSTVLPLTGAPTTELRGVHTPFASPLFFPMRLWTTNYFSSLSGGGGTSLLVTPAQHRTVDAAGTTLRQYGGLDLRLFYSDLTDTSRPLYAAAALSDAPTIVHVDAVPGANVTTFVAEVVGDPAAAIHQVWVTLTSGAGGSGAWTSIDLQQCGTPAPAACGSITDSRYWMAQVATASLPVDTKYVVQAVSGVGLVSLDDNLGRYYSISTAASGPVATTMSFAGSLPASVSFGGTLTVTARLQSNGSPLAGKSVTVTAGSSTRVATTDGTGNATVAVVMTSLPGTYAVTASFGGDAEFLPSAASAASTVTITRAVTALTLVSPTSVQLTAQTGQPLIQESVQFLISVAQGLELAFGTTDYLGRAVPTGFPAGTYTILQACFVGNTTYTDAKLDPTRTCPYYGFGGFLGPVDNPPILNVAKAGQSIPVRFSLGGYRGLAIFAAGSPTSQVVSCTGSALVSPIEQTVSAGSSSLQYDSATDVYTYVWKTDKSWANTCRTLVLTFIDGTQQRANFQFKN